MTSLRGSLVALFVLGLARGAAAGGPIAPEPGTIYLFAAGAVVLGAGAGIRAWRSRNRS